MILSATLILSMNVATASGREQCNQCLFHNECPNTQYTKVGMENGKPCTRCCWVVYD
ncbi:unnamed protein product [Cunninghamella blakesleeana]